MRGPILHDDDQGSGPPTLVFLHYFAGSLRSWVHVAGDLSRSCRCLSLDLPGFGRSAPLSTYSVQTVAQAVAMRISDCRLDNYVLVGHSMGGKLALACAAAEPPGLAGLVLVAPAPPSPEPMDPTERAPLLAAQARREQDVDDRSIAQRPTSCPDAELFGVLGPATASELMEPLEAIADALEGSDLLRREGPWLERRQP